MNAFHPFRRFWKSTGSTRRKVQQPPRLERLEERETPAGAVTATLSGGTLSIVAVDDTSKNGVLDGLNDQKLTLAGGVGAFTVSGTDLTTVNGLPAQTFKGVTSVRLDMRQGNDEVTVAAAVLSGTLTFNGGDGNDRLIIGSGVAVPKSFGAVTVNGGDGDDGLIIGNGTTTISHALTFNGGAGDSGVTLGLAAGDELSVGTMSIANGEGNDQILVGEAKFTSAGAVTINNGVSATSRVVMDADVVNLGGNLTITNLAGDDEVTLGSAAGAFTSRGVTINNGNGGAKVLFAATTQEFTGSVSITNGDGMNSVTLGSMTVTGNVTINNRGGGSTTAFKGVTVAVLGNLSVSSGNGFDTLLVDSANLTVHGGFTINTGAGGSNSVLTPTAHLAVDGATRITCGSDQDKITVGTPLTTISLNSLSVNVGNGGSTTEFDGPAELTGNLSVNGQEGLDNFLAAGTLTVDRNASFSLGAGPYSVRFAGMGTEINGSLSVRGLDGADSFKTGGVGFTVNGATNISSGEGGLFLDLASKENKFNGPLSISASTGSNTLNFTGALTSKSVTINSTGITNATFLDDVTIMGNLNLTTGGQDDTVKLAFPLYVSGSATVNTGAGDDLLDWEVAGATVLGNMTVRTGDGADTVNLTDFTVGGAFNVDLGSLDDSVSIDDCTFFGSVLINAGSGSDQVRIEQADTGAATTFKGPVTVRLGSGDDKLMIGRDSDLNDRGLFSQHVTIDGGSGLDIAALLPVTDGGTRSNDFAFFPTFPGVEAIT